METEEERIIQSLPADRKYNMTAFLVSCVFCLVCLVCVILAIYAFLRLIGVF